MEVELDMNEEDCEATSGARLNWSLLRSALHEHDTTTSTTLKTVQVGDEERITNLCDPPARHYRAFFLEIISRPEHPEE